MDTLTVALAATCPVLFGNISFRAFGFTKVDVTKKKIRSRNTMSVMEDIENPASTFVVRLKAISLIVLLFFLPAFGPVQDIHEVDGGAFHHEYEIGNLGCEEVVSEICENADDKTSHGRYHGRIYTS